MSFAKLQHVFKTAFNGPSGLLILRRKQLKETCVVYGKRSEKRKVHSQGQFENVCVYFMG